MSENNIFRFATKELSQDAFLAWLVNWINEKENNENKNIRKCAQSFLKQILKNKEEWIKIIENGKLDKIDVEVQFFNIDVLILLKEKNDDKYLAIIIEDKVSTSEHDAQIEYYKYHLHENLAKRYNYKHIEKEKLEILTVYYKPYDECNVERKNVDCVFTRENIIKLCNEFKEKTNQVYFRDYCEYIEAIEKCAKEKDIDESEEVKIIEKKKDDIKYLAFFRELQDGKDGDKKSYQEYIDNKINNGINEIKTLQYYGEVSENIKKLKEKGENIVYSYIENEKIYFGIGTTKTGKTWWCNLPLNIQINSKIFNKYAFIKINFYENKEDTITLKFSKKKVTVVNKEEYDRAKSEFKNEKIIYFCECKEDGKKYKYNLYNTFDTRVFKKREKEDVYKKINEKMTKTKEYCKEKDLKIKLSDDGSTKQQPEMNIFTIHLPSKIDNKMKIIEDLIKTIVEDLDGQKMNVYTERENSTEVLKTEWINE